MCAQPALALDDAASPPRPVHFLDRAWNVLVAVLVAGDALGLIAAFAVAYLIRFKTGIPLLDTPPHRIVFYSSVAFLVIPVWLLIFALHRLYDRQRLFAGLQEYIRVINASTVGLVVVIVASFLALELSISRGWLLLVWALSILSVSTWRFAARRLLRRAHARGLFATRTIIVGANDEARAVAEQFLDDAGSGIQIVGFVDNALPSYTHVVGGRSVIGRLWDLPDLVRTHQIHDLVVATTSLSRDQLVDLYATFGHVDNVTIHLSSGLFDVLTTGVSVREVSYVPLMTPDRVRITGVDAVLKATLDIVVAASALIALSPLFLLVAMAVRLDSPGPAFHRRRVLGRSGKSFYAFKFRTMVVNADAALAADPRLNETFRLGHKLKSDPRVTRIGAFLRRTSLDELPQLLNVLRGEMSLVGPRMIAPDEVIRYGKWQYNLLTVKPGITGPWQVRGRSDIPYDDRVRLSMHYIRNYTLWLDLEILLRTVPAVLQARGAY
jgi:exopolysaccharide biosynthesis polyprenyl glycosylphosphotransferase